MITRTPISTISYNTDYYLYQKLNEKIKSGDIEFFAFIHHLPELDETKAHKHLYIIPSSNIDTFSLQHYLEEIDLSFPDKPLGCLLFRHSKFSDWFLYAIHDKDYLASKNESRLHHYTSDDIVCSSYDYLNELIHISDFAKYKTFARLRESVESGVSFRDLVYNGFIPIQQKPFEIW